MILLAAAIALLPADVGLVTDRRDVTMPNDEGQIRLFYHNRSPFELRQLVLRVEGNPPAGWKVQPAAIPRCLPGERCVFLLRFTRKKETGFRRLPVTVSLSAEGRPGFHRSRIFVDATRNAGRDEEGWLDAGTIQVERSASRTRLIVLLVATALPVIVLLWLGARLKRRSEKK